MTDLLAIVKLLDEIIKMEKKVEMLIASEGDKKRRKKLEKAFKDRDRAAVADVLFNV
jgi:hypothetical protein